MITKIIACADIHIRNLRRQEEYQQQLKKFIDDCKKIVKENTDGETRIVIAGDLLNNKLDISGEGYLVSSWFLKQLDKICPTIIIAGNHDLNMLNLNRLDPITTIFSMCKFKQVYYLDKDLGYESGCMVDDNIVWCLYSSFDKFAKPNIVEERIANENKTFVALFHGELTNSKTDTGYISKNGIPPSYFDGVDFGILGHIHKRQEINFEGIPLVYCGSLIQQSFGENITGHGYVIWDVNSIKYESIDIENKEYGFYTIKIENIDDIDNDTERLLNI